MILGDKTFKNSYKTDLKLYDNLIAYGRNFKEYKIYILKSLVIILKLRKFILFALNKYLFLLLKEGVLKF